MVCRATTISAATTMGSAPACGREACPPTPRTVTVSPADAAISGPPRVANTPRGSVLEKTCSPYAAETRGPAASSTPSAIIAAAPS